jgi:two-component system NarL family sensor kinase
VRDEERRDIASDLHDGPLQELYSARFLLDELSALRQRDSYADVLTRLEHHLMSARGAIRNACGMLHPPLLDGLLEWEIRRFVDSVAAYSGSTEIVVQQVVELRALTSSTARNVFRVFRIALLNALNHAHCSKILIRLYVDTTGVALDVEDNGRGFSTGAAHNFGRSHHGLLLARTYAQALNGNFEVAELPQGGTLVRYSVPLGSRWSLFTRFVRRYTVSQVIRPKRARSVQKDTITPLPIQSTHESYHDRNR